MGFLLLMLKRYVINGELSYSHLMRGGKIFDPCNIDEIAATVKIIEICEVSAHYE